jgi:hypothetical protein
VGKIAQAHDNAVERRQQDASASLLEHQRMGDVVDVLGRTAEMDELGNPHHFRVRLEAVLEPVLDGLDVVIGARLYRLDRFGVLNRKAGNGPIEFRYRRGGKCSDFSDRGSRGQRLQPLDLDPDPVSEQTEFREMGAQGFDLSGIAAVQRGKGSQGR